MVQINNQYGKTPLVIINTCDETIDFIQKINVRERTFIFFSLSYKYTCKGNFYLYICSMTHFVIETNYHTSRYTVVVCMQNLNAKKKI